MFHITDAEPIDGREQVSAHKEAGGTLDKVSADHSGTGLCRQLAVSLLWLLHGGVRLPGYNTYLYWSFSAVLCVAVLFLAQMLDCLYHGL